MLLRVENDTYVIGGGSPAALLAAMAESGPIVRGERAVASTHAQVKLGPSPTCGPFTELVVRVTVPERSPGASDPALDEWWDAVSAIIADHERQHVAIWEDAVDELREQLATTPCREAAGAIGKWREEVDARHRAFDEHEGLATWPEYPLPRVAAQPND